MKIRCDYCAKKLKEPGAQVIGPPESDGRSLHLNVCRDCWDHGLGVVPLAPPTPPPIVITLPPTDGSPPWGCYPHESDGISWTTTNTDHTAVFVP